MKTSEIIEFEKKDPVTSDIYWVSAALTKDKHDRRPHVKFIYVKNGVFTATDGNRLHVYQDSLSCKDGFYSVIKRNKTNVILKFEGAGDVGMYPETESLLSTKDYNEPFLAFPEAGNCSGPYAHIARAMESGALNYNFLADLFLTGDHFDVFIKDAESPVIFKNGKKTAALMPMRSIEPS